MQLAEPLYHNISMWQELLRVFVLIGVEQRGKVRGSRTDEEGGLWYCVGELCLCFGVE